MPTFDGINLVITLDSATTNVEVQDVYEAWKDWVRSSPVNRAYPKAFRPLGGDPLTPALNAGSYFFLQNDVGWRLRPPEEDIIVLLTGNLAGEDSLLPLFIPTTGAYTAAIIGIQPITQGVNALSSAGVTTAVWGALTSANQGVGTFGKIVGKVLTVGKYLGLK